MARKIVVQKYGGTSVATPELIKRVAQRAVACKKDGNHVAVVVSASGDTTDELLDLASQITATPSNREMDMLLSTGEQISVALLAMAIQELGYEAISLTGAQVGIMTDHTHTKARIIDIATKRMKAEFRRGRIIIVAGFQGMSADNEITTLGRGGSDLTAVALAKVLKASVCEIYTDVDGVYTADPRFVTEARKIKQISYEEMLELASLGAQVLQARSIEVAKKYSVPLHVRSTFTNKEGTMISKEVKSMEGVLVTGITSNKNEAKLTICDVPDQPGVAAKIFETIAAAHVNVDMIIQNIGHTGKADVSFTVPKTDLKLAVATVEKLKKKIGAGKVVAATNIAKLSVVGVGMRSHSGVAAIMFKALAKAGVNIGMIATSEIKISCVIDKDQTEKAVTALHKAFGLARARKKIR